MEYADMKEWLDKLIQNLEERISLVEFNSRIRTYYVDKKIAITDHIEEIADVIGIDLMEGKKNGKYFYFFFMYKGCEFYQLREERLERFAGTDRE